MHEASLYEHNAFITLTYKEEKLSLDYRDFQLFMKLLRWRFRGQTIRFYMCGEYGELNSRAHFHACLFNMQFPDLQYHGRSPAGEKIWRSPTLEALWPHGFSSVGRVTFKSAAYVARYAMKKLGGKRESEVLDIIDPHTGELFWRRQPFSRMSLGTKDGLGGIGKPWLMKFMDDVYPHGKVVVNAVESRAPRYYDNLFVRRYGKQEAMRLSVRRAEESKGSIAESLPGRLEARSEVAKARIKMLKRTIT